MRVLIIGAWMNELHRLEFAEPVARLVKEPKLVHYSRLSLKELEWAQKIIICGTSLQDKGYPVEDFRWLKKCKVPVLGICAGMQLIGQVFGFKLIKQLEIGFRSLNFEKEYLGLSGEVEVYDMHSLALDESISSKFEVYASTEVPQAIRHKQIYGVLFHPEARTKQLISNFVSGE